MMPDVPEEVTELSCGWAERAFTILGCRGVARADFIWDEDDDGTESNTVSSEGNATYEMPAGSTEGEITQPFFWNYQKAKSAWCSHMGKPTRAVRRFVRKRARASKQPKGKGKGKRAGSFFTALNY